MIESARLADGVSLFLDRVPGSPVAAIGYWFRIGSRDEAPGEEGYAHFLEHMLFKGTVRRSARQIALEVDRVGGFLNAFTEKEVTCYHCTVPREALALAVDVLTDMIRSSRLDPAELDKEKNVIASEIKAAEDVAEDVAHELYVEDLFPGQTLARRITGTARQVRSTTPESLRDFYHRRYGPATLLVGVAGDLTLQTAVDMVGSALAGWDRAAEIPPRQAAAPNRCWVFRRGRSEQMHFYTGTVDTTAQTLRDYYVSLVSSTLIGESMSSRLFQSLRETHALCYSVMSFRTQLTDASLWTIYASTTPSVGLTFLQRLGEELARLKAEPPDDGEVADARSHLRGSLILAQEDMETRMKRMIRQVLMTGRALEYDESLRELERVGRPEVREMIERTVDAGRFSLLVYGGGWLGRLRRFRYAF